MNKRNLSSLNPEEICEKFRGVAENKIPPYCKELLLEAACRVEEYEKKLDEMYIEMMDLEEQLDYMWSTDVY